VHEVQCGGVMMCVNTEHPWCAQAQNAQKKAFFFAYATHHAPMAPALSDVVPCADARHERRRQSSEPLPRRQPRQDIYVAPIRHDMTRGEGADTDGRCATPAEMSHASEIMSA